MDHQHENSFYDSQCLTPLRNDFDDAPGCNLTPLIHNWNIQSQTASPQRQQDDHETQMPQEFGGNQVSDGQGEDQSDFIDFIPDDLIDYNLDFHTWESLWNTDHALQVNSPLQGQSSCSSVSQQQYEQQSDAGSVSFQQGYYQSDDQSSVKRPESQKRKMEQISAAQVIKKRQRTQQKERKDIIESVIAALPASVIKEQQKSIQTAFPSRMRQTRMQAAIKAQTQNIVQSCQQRIMGVKTLPDLTESRPSMDRDGNEIQYIGAYTLEERRLRIARFHEKRKERVWSKTVKYTCRRKLAVGRTRIKGRFVKTDGQDSQYCEDAPYL